MNRLALVIVLIAAAAMTAATSAVARNNASDLVFVQTNELSGNRIVVLDRGADGGLSEAGRYPTGGLGGRAEGAVSDWLASQGSLVFDERRTLLLAVNAGSDTVTSFRVQKDRLKRLDVEPSGGSFPASIAVHDDVAYVLNAGGEGRLQGFTIRGNGLRPLAGSSRSLGLGNAPTPNFLTSPGQVGFTPDGRWLLVTTKASKSTIEVFRVGPDGRLSATSVSTASATPVPFAFTFDPAGRVVVGEAGASSVTTYSLNADGTLSSVASLTDGQVALCWIQAVDGFYYVANTGSDTLSGYRIDAAGVPSLVTPDGIVATTEPGPIDLTAPSEGGFLYGQTGVGGTIDEYRVNADGTLAKIGVVNGLPVGMEGIAST
jgi:6-phosphogluconolactonase (cycloisomerase 2 family)